mgnify:CR=1 FL=1
MRGALGDPQVAHRGALAEVQDGGGTFKVMNLPFRMSGAKVAAAPRMSTLGEWLDHPVGGPVLRERIGTRLSESADLPPALFTLVRGIPLAKFSTFGIGLTPDVVDELVAAVSGGGA